MDYEKLSETLYQRAAGELEAYHSHLLRQTPEEILEHTLEYTTKADILMSLIDIEEEDLNAGQLKALLESSSPLEDIYRAFRDVNIGLMDAIRECAGELADSRIAGQQQGHRRSVREQLAAKSVPGGNFTKAAAPQKER